MNLRSLTISDIKRLETEIMGTLNKVRAIRHASEIGDIPPSQAKKLLREAGIKIAKP